MNKVYTIKLTKTAIERAVRVYKANKYDAIDYTRNCPIFQAIKVRNIPGLDACGVLYVFFDQGLKGELSKEALAITQLQAQDWHTAKPTTFTLTMIRD